MVKMFLQHLIPHLAYLTLESLVMEVSRIHVVDVSESMPFGKCA